MKSLAAFSPAIVITTYNNPKSLGLLLKSLLLQTEKNFKIFIADDGSSEETKLKIDFFKGRFLNPIEHFWHPDEGYQKAKINNKVFKSIVASHAHPVCICIDGDTFLHPQFVEDHMQVHVEQLQKNRLKVLFMGRRVDFGPWITHQMTEEKVLEFLKNPMPFLMKSYFLSESQNLLRSFRIKNPVLRKVFKMDRVPDLLGSNFSISTALLEEINGYNEDFKSYWGEDGDLFVRARNVGALLLGGKYIAVQYHLFHKRLEPTPENVKRYQELLEKKDYKRAVKGIAEAQSAIPMP